MVVAKRQRRENPAKIEQRKVRGLELGPQVKLRALLASSVYIGLAQREEKKHIKRGVKIGLGVSLLFIFWVCPPSLLEDVFSFACQ